MENKNLLTLTITLVVGIILAGSLLAPVITDAQHATSDISTALNDNNSSYIAETTDYAYFVSSDTETINGKAISVGEYTQVITTDAGVFYKIRAGTYTLFIPGENVKVLITLGTSVPNITATVENGVFTVRYGDNEYTANVTNAYAYTGDGEYSESPVSWPSFITNKGTSGLITVGDGYYSPLNGIAIIDDWTTGKGTFNYYSNDWVESSAPVTWDVVDNGDGSYTISNIAIDSTDALPTPHRTLYQNEYWTYTPTAVSNLLGAVPILVIVAILMVAVGAIAYRRAD